MAPGHGKESSDHLLSLTDLAVRQSHIRGRPMRHSQAKVIEFTHFDVREEALMLKKVALT